MRWSSVAPIRCAHSRSPVSVPWNRCRRNAAIPSPRIAVASISAKVRRCSCCHAEEGAVRLCGWGESSDAHHMSAPDPSGQGRARGDANRPCRASGLRPADIDYINLHGTATPQNDAMEAAVVACVVRRCDTGQLDQAADRPCARRRRRHRSRAVLAQPDRQSAGRLPGHWWDGVGDAALPRIHLVPPGSGHGGSLRHALTQNFAFGGSNAALVLGAG